MLPTRQAPASSRPYHHACQAIDAHNTSALLGRQYVQALLANKVYESPALRMTIGQMGAVAVIPSKRNTRSSSHDPNAYHHRNRIERCSSKFQHFRRFATHHDRRTVHLAAAMNWLN